MGAILRKYGTATTVLFPLIDRGTLDFESTPVTFVAADTQISKDEGAFANTGSTPAHEGNGMYSLALTATEMQAARIMVTVIDAATKAWEDQAILVETYGDASAEHAVDLDDSVRAGLTALPNAAAEAAGGLYTRGTGAGQINQPANGQIDANVVAMASAVVTAAAIATDAIGSDEFTQGAADKVWSTAARTLTALGFVLDATDLAADTIGASEFAQAAADKVFGSGGAALAELSQGVPASTPRPDQAIMLLYMALRNKLDVTSALKEVHNDAGAVITKKALTDDGSTYSEAEMETGP